MLLLGVVRVDLPIVRRQAQGPGRRFLPTGALRETLRGLLRYLLLPS